MELNPLYADKTIKNLNKQRQIKIKLYDLVIDETFLPRRRLDDKRTKEINQEVILDLANYIETNRIRRTLPNDFIERIESYLEEFLDRVIDGDIISSRLALDDIYECLYLDYPDVKRKFFECVRRRRERLTSSGETKIEARRRKESKLNLADRKYSEKQRINRVKESKLFNKFNTLAMKNPKAIK